ncbi:MAG: hypothetical protein QG670_2586 [Thermoproteota archaeon]|nr:hypothetical protein [Thermoproteota archaeon]
MMIRCNKCHMTFNLTNDTMLWLCPACGEYEDVKSSPRDVGRLARAHWFYSPLTYTSEAITQYTHQ